MKGRSAAGLLSHRNRLVLAVLLTAGTFVFYGVLIEAFAWLMERADWGRRWMLVAFAAAAFAGFLMGMYVSLRRLPVLLASGSLAGALASSAVLATDLALIIGLCYALNLAKGAMLEAIFQQTEPLEPQRRQIEIWYTVVLTVEAVVVIGGSVLW